MRYLPHNTSLELDPLPTPGGALQRLPSQLDLARTSSFLIPQMPEKEPEVGPGGHERIEAKTGMNIRATAAATATAGARYVNLYKTNATYRFSYFSQYIKSIFKITLLQNDVHSKED